MRNGCENVECAVPLGRKRRVGDTGILDVKAGVIAEDVLVLDFVEVLRVVLCDVDGVVRQVEGAFHAKIHHEGRTGVLLLRQLLIGPTAAEMVGNHSLHGTGKVRVNDHRIGAMRALTGADAHRATTGEQNLFHRLIKANVDSQPPGNPGHRNRNGRAAADGVEDAVFVFEEAQDAEQAWATKRGHPQIF